MWVSWLNIIIILLIIYLLISIQWSWKVAAVTEVPPVALLPNFIVQRVLLKPLRLQTGGTVLVRIKYNNCIVILSYKMVLTLFLFLFYEPFASYSFLLQAGKLAVDRGWAINVGMLAVILYGLRLLYMHMQTCQTELYFRYCIYYLKHMKIKSIIYLP